jgi:hypothetical protein
LKLVEPGGFEQGSLERVAKQTSGHRRSIHQKAHGHDRPSSASSSTRAQNGCQLKETQIRPRGISKLRIALGFTGFQRGNSTPQCPGKEKIEIYVKIPPEYFYLTAAV